MEMYINGPINYVKLESKETSQTIWIFFDRHDNVEAQSKCEDYDSKDVEKYFKKVFDETKEPIDFFFEISQPDPNYTVTSINSTNEKYLWQVEKLFVKYFKNNPNNHLRLHYIDIRQHIHFTNIYNTCWDVSDYVFSTSLNSLNFNYVFEKLDYLVISLKSMLDIVDQIRSNVDGNTSTDTNPVYKTIYKILLKYNNEQTKKLVTNYFNKYFYDFSKDLIEFINDLIKELKVIEKRVYIIKNTDQVYTNKWKTYTYTEFIAVKDREYLKSTKSLLNDKLYFLLNMVPLAGCCVMDCYFLRRFLEKSNMVKKIITYTGGYHSIVYVWFLVKYANFQIIDCEYLLEGTNIEKASTLIKQASEPHDVSKLFIRSKNTQCVKLKNIL